MRVTLMIPSLGAGGAERVMTLLANNLRERGHEVYLLTLAGSRDDFFGVGSGVRRIALDLTGNSSSMLGAARANIRRIRAIRAVVRHIRPDAVLSFITSMNVLAILACVGLPVRVVVSERIDPRSHHMEQGWARLRTAAYRYTDALVAQTADAADWFRQQLGKRIAVTTIPNPVMAAVESAAVDVAIPRPFMLAAGRLVQQKGFDLLIHAFADVARTRPELNLVIAGEGPEAPTLKRLAAEMGVAERVFFPGRVRELPGFMKEATGFVLSSRYEGFPNVLLEALASGLPVIATDCPGGPREILCDGAYGLLVSNESVRGLGEAMIRLASDADLRERLSRTASKAIARYEVGAVTTAWEQVLLGS
jgi:glycosyltransferase involved in cell wall biosynthesis